MIRAQRNAQIFEDPPGLALIAAVAVELQDAGSTQDGGLRGAVSSRIKYTRIQAEGTFPVGLGRLPTAVAASTAFFSSC